MYITFFQRTFLIYFTFFQRSFISKLTRFSNAQALGSDYAEVLHIYKLTRFSNLKFTFRLSPNFHILANAVSLQTKLYIYYTLIFINYYSFFTNTVNIICTFYQKQMNFIVIRILIQLVDLLMIQKCLEIDKYD